MSIEQSDGPAVDPRTDGSAVDRRTVLIGTAAAIAVTGTIARTPVAAAQSRVIATTADVPVGGGKIIDEIVVTQPRPGEFHAFFSTCTHQGCRVGSVRNGTINCHCHGSKFTLEGRVAQGPAFIPLICRTVHIEGDKVVLDPIIPGTPA